MVHRARAIGPRPSRDAALVRGGPDRPLLGSWTRSSPPPAQAGRMFGLTGNALSGSYFALTSASRWYRAFPTWNARSAFAHIKPVSQPAMVLAGRHLSAVDR